MVDTATALGIPVVTVRSRLARARETLRAATDHHPPARKTGKKLQAGGLVLCQPCSDVFRADLLPHGLAVGGGDGEAVPGDVDGGGA